jgi:hypothetical protein
MEEHNYVAFLLIHLIQETDPASEQLGGLSGTLRR